MRAERREHRGSGHIRRGRRAVRVPPHGQGAARNVEKSGGRRFGGKDTSGGLPKTHPDGSGASSEHAVSGATMGTDSWLNHHGGSPAIPGSMGTSAHRGASETLPPKSKGPPNNHSLFWHPG